MKAHVRIAALFPLLLAGLLLGLVFPTTAPARDSEDENVSTTRTGETGLLSIPAPPLEQLEKAVADQLLEGQRMVETIARSEEASATDKARVFGQLGQMYMAYELNEAAEASLRNAVSLAPDFFNWTYSLAYLLQIMGKYDEAIPLYNQLLSRQPDDGLLLTRLGECYRGMNQLESAKRAFEKAYQINPNEAATLARMGDVALAEKRFRDAVDLLTSALEKQPGANRLHYQLAMAYRGLKDMKNARLHLSRMGKVGVQPRDPLKEHLEQLITGYRIHIINGKMAHAAGRPRDAIREFEKAMKASPDRPEAYVNIAATLGQIGEFRPAVAMLEKAVEIQPENEAAHFNLGALLGFLGDYEASTLHLQIVVKKNPDDALAHFTLADTFREWGKDYLAFTHYLQTVNLDSTFTEAWLWMGNYLIRTGQFKEALTVMETANEEQPRDGLIAHALARLLAGSPDAGLRDGQRALNLASAVYKANPHFNHAITLAMAFAELGRCDQAVQWQTAAIDAAVKLPGARPLLGVMNRNLNHYKTQRPCKAPSMLAQEK